MPNKTSFVLAFARRIPGKSAHHIAKSLGFSSATVSGILYRLAKSNRVSRQLENIVPYSAADKQSWRYYA